MAPAAYAARTMVIGVSFAGFLSAASVAAVVDLVDSTSGSVNGALFVRDDFQPAGTGVLNSFVRIRHAHGPSNNGHSPEGEEQGYNTSGRPVQYDERTDPNFTRDLRFGEIPVVQLDNVRYKEFLLDINEPNAGDSSLLSLDQVRIYTSPIGGQTGLESTLGTLRYSLGDFLDDNVVTLDDKLSSGSGQGEMRMYVPLSNFAGATSDDFVYLYSYFGHLSQAYETGGGAEEWAVVPEPGTAVLGGLVALYAARRRR